MIITTTRKGFPGTPFGRGDNFSMVSIGDSYTSRYPFEYDDIRIPTGTRISLLEKNDRFSRWELTFPEKFVRADNTNFSQLALEVD